MILAQLLKEHPIVVTGVGAHTAAGAATEALWQQALRGVSSAAWLPGFGLSGEKPFAGCSSPAPRLDGDALRIARKMDRSVHLGLAAAMEARRGARLESATAAPARTGVIVGTTRGPVGKWSEAEAQLRSGRMSPSLAASSSLASLSGAVAVASGARGPCLTIAAACASGAAAIVVAAQQILTGAADVMIAGGAEAPLNAVVLAQLRAAGVLGSHTDPARTCRPFDVTRNGLVPGEGAAFLVLESLESARGRGARVLARLAGWALGSDAESRLGSDKDGEELHRVMHEALVAAGLEPRQVSCVSTHGTGTVLNDLAEARAIARLFGPQGVPCSATKPVTGHCLGASAAIEAVLSVRMLVEQVIPPTANCVELDPECAVDLVVEKPRAAPVSAVMSNSSGFWGNHASVILAAA